MGFLLSKVLPLLLYPLGLGLLLQLAGQGAQARGGRVSFTSGDPAPPEALWARDLAQELGLPASRILLNPGSRTTAEEARDIGRIGRSRGWKRVLLVNSAFHMPRALATFRQRSGLSVVPVACDYQLPSRANFGKPTAGSVVKSLLPDAEFLYLSTVALKEHIGLVAYRLKGWT